MIDLRTCSVCGVAIPSNIEEGFCLNCEFERALKAESSTRLSETIDAEAGEASGAESASTRSFGDYEVIRELGAGGMGTVFEARQVALNRRVALKFISAGVLASRDTVKRFKAEAEAAAALHLPNIVPIFEIGEHAGNHFFSMGLIDGPTLGGALGRKPMGTREAAELLSVVAGAVQFAHERGVLHRS